MYKHKEFTNILKSVMNMEKIFLTGACQPFIYLNTMQEE